MLPKGTGFITDLGMTGPFESVLGIKPEQSIGRFLGDVPRRYECAPGKAKLEGALFTVDEATGRCLEVQMCIRDRLYTGRTYAIASASRASTARPIFFHMDITSELT